MKSAQFLLTFKRQNVQQYFSNFGIIPLTFVCGTVTELGPLASSRHLSLVLLPSLELWPAPVTIFTKL